MREQLADAEDLAKRTTQQYESLTSLRGDLMVLKQQMEEFHKAHAEAAQMRDALDTNRTAFARFLDRMDAFRVTMPELDARMNAISGKLSVVDEGTRKASNLVALADNLDRQMTRIINNQKLVEKVDSRINTLHGIAADVDRKVEEQLNRRTEIEGLRNACDGVAVQVADVQQKIEAVAAVQASLVPLTAAVESLKNDVDRTSARFKEMQRDEAILVEQEKKLADILVAGRTVATETAATMQQVLALTDELKRASAEKNELLDELVTVQARQREVASHTAVTDDHLKRLEAAVEQMEHRRSQMAFMERTIAGFEAKLTTLKQAAEEVDRKIEAVGARESVVDAVRREVDGVRELSARSKADLQAMNDRRAELASVKNVVDAILAKAGQTQEQLSRIEARRRDVDEIVERTSMIVSMLEDVRLNLELVNEQKAVVEHVTADLAQMNALVQSGQRTLKALQAERELAERIERSIKALRAMGGAGEDDKAAQRSA